MKKRLSIVDIAKQLNISQTTVSFILNGKSKEKRISDEVSEKVLRFVKEVGYKPNMLARSFRTGKTNIIGLMVEDISNPFFAHIARLIEEKAYANDYKILYCSTENNPEKAEELLQMFQDRRVDGYIITPTINLAEQARELVNNGAPVVLFDRYFEDHDFDHVVLDNEGATYSGMQHLVEQGYKNIGFVTINSLQSQMAERLRGYERGVADFGLNEYIKEVSYTLDQEQTIQHIEAFLKRKTKLDAVIFSTNYLGVSGLKAIKRLGLKIPDDLAVLSFDDHILFDLHQPGISCIGQPIEEMSDRLINILLKKLSSSKTAEKNIVQLRLPAQLIIRESTRKVK